MKNSLLYMWKPVRTQLIDNHNFYVTEAKRRLLSQFDDIELEADVCGKKKLNEYSGCYNPESDNAQELQEAAYEELCSHYAMLESMRNRTRLSVVSGMFHEFDKQLREWISNEIKHSFKGVEIQKAIWVVNFQEILNLFECLGWRITEESCCCSLDRCRLVVNAYKHGEGAAFETIKINHKDLIEDENPEYRDIISHRDLKVGQVHIQEFSDAIVGFWKCIPENVYLNEGAKVPKWFEKAYAKDQGNI